MSTPLVEAEGVDREYRRGGEAVHALVDVSFTVAPGEFVVVTGPSGSGKSTLLHVLAGLDRPDEGTIRLEGRDIAGMSDDELTLYRRRRMGFIFQFFHLLPTLSAIENVALPLLLDGLPSAQANRVAGDRLESLGIGGRAEHRPRELSGGEQQRTAVARALVAEPALLLADEPTGNLDSVSGAEVYRILTDLPRRFGTSVVMVTHDPNAEGLGDRSLHLRDGRLTPDGGSPRGEG